LKGIFAFRDCFFCGRNTPEPELGFNYVRAIFELGEDYVVYVVFGVFFG
jgi:hypothetical protein